VIINSQIKLKNMKNKLLLIIAVVIMVFPKTNFGQAPSLGVAAKFVLYSSNGAVTHTGAGMDSHITGDVGSQIGGSSGFGNVDGVMHNIADGVTASALADLNVAYLNLSLQGPGAVHVALLGAGETILPGIYSIALPATPSLNGVLTLDGQGDPNAYFLFKLGNDFSTASGAQVKLINGAKACNVFWLVEGVVSIATLTTMRGNIIAHNTAINIATDVILEGRALTTGGAISVNTKLVATTPIGCGSTLLTGPAAPNLASAACYAVFSSVGPVTDDAASFLTGDVGTNLGSTLGYDPLKVVGAIHPIPDGSTGQCATDIGPAYNYLNTLPYDIELLVPSEFGHSLVLTPHTYRLNAPGPTALTDTLFLNAEGDANAVFVIQINSAFSTSTYSAVVLQNGAKAINVYWKIDGAVDINDYSVFKGTIVSAGAITLKTGVQVEGRVLTSVGAINTFATMVNIPVGSCGPAISLIDPISQTACVGDSVSFTVTATGVGLTYQWRKGLVNLVDGGNISGVHNDTLTINPVSLSDAGNNYNVVVTGTFPPSVTSSNVSLIVNGPAVITSEPSNQTVCADSSASFSVVSSGTGLTYQWRKGNVNLINGVNIMGADSTTLVINAATIADTAYNYNVIVMAACGKDTSINVSLRINNPAIIITEPSNQTVCADSTASFSVVATGSGLTYKWRKGNVDLINGVNIMGADSTTLIINTATIADTAYNYNVVVMAGCGKDTSINVSLRVNNPAIIISEPSNQTVCADSSASFSVVATGSGLTYQWRKGNVDLINGVNVSGVSTSMLVINSATIADTAYNYNVVVMAGCGNDTSINVSLRINNPAIIITEPLNQTVCSGSSASFSVVATGSGLTYKWRKGNVDLINGVNVIGADSTTLVILASTIADTAYNYNVVVMAGCGNDTSINVSLRISPATGAVSFTAGATMVCQNAPDELYTATAANSISMAYTASPLAAGVMNALTGVMNWDPTFSGTATITATSTGLCGSTNANRVVTVNPTTGATSFTAGATTVCQNAPDETYTATAANSTSIVYSVLPASSGVINSASGLMNWDPLFSGTATITASSTGLCGSTNANQTVTVNPTTGATSFTAGATTVCQNAADETYTATAANSTSITYSVLPATAGVINSATGVMNWSSSFNGTATITATANGMCGTTTANRVVTVNTIPSANAGSDSPVCVGGSINLTAQTVSGAIYSWTSTTGYTSSVQNPVIAAATMANAGDYSLTVTTNGCTSGTSTVTVVVTNCADLSVVKTVSSTHPIFGKTIVFTIVATNNGPNNSTSAEVNDVLQNGYSFVSSTSTAGSYNAATSVWTIGNLNSGASATLTITVTVVAGGNYVNTAIIYSNDVDANMANNTSTVETIPSDFFIPEGFSPNGDGVNDLFVIRGILNYSENTFMIFNRWGDKVFEASPYQNTWDGKCAKGLRMGGDELPTGTYFYILDLKDGSDVYKGTIYLNK
jgi:gliding motility-associated-like protein/uncharacterized repeat protein (TIGR01451 family)